MLAAVRSVPIIKWSFYGNSERVLYQYGNSECVLYQYGNSECVLYQYDNSECVLTLLHILGYQMYCPYIPILSTDSKEKLKYSSKVKRNLSLMSILGSADLYIIKAVWPLCS